MCHESTLWTSRLSAPRRLAEDLTVAVKADCSVSPPIQQGSTAGGPVRDNGRPHKGTIEKLFPNSFLIVERKSVLVLM